MAQGKRAVSGQSVTPLDGRMLLPWLQDRLGGLTRAAPRTVSGRVEALALALVVLSALILRLATLDGDSLWIDEGYTLAAAQLPLSTMWSVPFDTHPPLHFTIVKFFSWIGDPEWAVRLPSALFGLATLAPLYLLARRQLGNFGAIIAISVWALAYTQIVYANNGRNYTQLLFFLTLALQALAIISERLAKGDQLTSRGMPAWASVYTLGALGALYTHNTAILYLFALNGALCGWQLLNSPRALLPFALRLGAINAPALLVWAPWLGVMLTTSGGFNWLEHKTPMEALFTLAATMGPNDTPAFAALAFFAALASGWSLVACRASLPNLLILFHLVVFPLFIWLIGYVYVPVFMERIILMVTLGAALAIGALAAHGRPASLALGLTALAIAATFASAIAYQLRGDQPENLGAHLVQDWREAIAEGEAEAPPGDDVGFVICDTFSWPVAASYAREGAVHVHRPDEYWQMTLEDWLELFGQPVNDRLETPLGTVTGQTRSPQELATSYSRIVFLQPDIYCQGPEARQIHAELLDAGFSPTQGRDWRGLKAHHYQR